MAIRKPPVAALTAAWGKPDADRTAVTETRIAHIADMMRTLKFRTGTTNYKLAEEWGLGIDRVKQLSTMASRRVKEEIADPLVVTVSLCTTMSKIIDEAMAPGGDRKLAISAGKVWADISGSFAPKVIMSVGKNDLPDDPDELLAIAREEMSKYTGTIGVVAEDGTKL